MQHTLDPTNQSSEKWNQNRCVVQPTCALPLYPLCVFRTDDDFRWACLNESDDAFLKESIAREPATSQHTKAKPEREEKEGAVGASSW